MDVGHDRVADEHRQGLDVEHDALGQPRSQEPVDEDVVERLLRPRVVHHDVDLARGTAPQERLRLGCLVRQEVVVVCGDALGHTRGDAEVEPVAPERPHERAGDGPLALVPVVEGLAERVPERVRRHLVPLERRERVAERVEVAGAVHRHTVGEELGEQPLGAQPALAVVGRADRLPEVGVRGEVEGGERGVAGDLVRELAEAGGCVRVVGVAGGGLAEEVGHALLHRDVGERVAAVGADGVGAGHGRRRGGSGKLSGRHAAPPVAEALRGGGASHPLALHALCVRHRPRRTGRARGQ